MQMMYDVSMDSATDAVLQQVIRKEISSSTVITVAHRVPTVTDSDMIEVLLGKIEKFDDLMVAVAAKGRHLETIKHDGKP